MDRHLVEVFESQRHHLTQVARRMLTSSADADDAVQDTWLRLQRADVSDVDNLAGWLTTTVSRICLDRLRTRASRAETLVGETPATAEAPDDPARDAEVADSVGRALSVVLETLSPAERVAFVLHDVFAVPFDEIAPILERSPEATKKLAGRARRRTQVGGSTAPTAPTAPTAAHRRTVEQFLTAIRAGDMTALLAVLAPDAVRHVDPVLLPVGRPATVRGAQAIVEEARTLSGPARTARAATIDGQPGAVVVRDGVVTLALTFALTFALTDDGLIASFEVIADPARLADMDVVLSPDA